MRRENTWLRREPMPFILGIVVLVALVIIPKMRVARGVNAADLGWMSERWLAEYRASQSGLQGRG